MPATLPEEWQEVDGRWHSCHSRAARERADDRRMMTFTITLFVLAWVAAIVGGLGLGGLGVDSRGLDDRQHTDERPWRSLLSR
jgi:hypothetical protein